MNDYSVARLYETMKQDLVSWVAGNPKLKHNITNHNLQYLFEFHKRNGLSIDLSRFDKEYYFVVFNPPEDKQELITDFVRKAITIMRNTLQRLDKEEISLTITVRHKVSKVSYWRTCYISQQFDPKNISQLSRKENDWQ
jgi:hypothetical protein